MFLLMAGVAASETHRTTPSRAVLIFLAKCHSVITLVFQRTGAPLHVSHAALSMWLNKIHWSYSYGVVWPGCISDKLCAWNIMLLDREERNMWTGTEEKQVAPCWEDFGVGVKLLQLFSAAPFRGHHCIIIICLQITLSPVSSFATPALCMSFFTTSINLPCSHPLFHPSSTSFV